MHFEREDFWEGAALRVDDVCDPDIIVGVARMHDDDVDDDDDI